MSKEIGEKFQEPLDTDPEIRDELWIRMVMMMGEENFIQAHLKECPTLPEWWAQQMREQIKKLREKYKL